MKKYLGMILLFYSLVVWPSSGPIIKVRIGKVLNKVNVSGLDLKRYIWPKKSLKVYSGQKLIEFNCKTKKKSAYKKPIRLASIQSLTGLLNWDEEKYKGILHIQTSEGLRGCDLVNELYMEDYLATLLPKEMNSNWPIEALKAQAVAARSYAFYKIKTKQVARSKGFKTYYDLESSEKHQVSGSYFDATKKTVAATRDTSGEVLSLSDGSLTPIFFHSKCGGRTLTPDQVWTNKVAGYRSVDCPFCHKHGTKNWKNKIPKIKLQSSIEAVLHKYENDPVSLRKKNMTLVNDFKKNYKVSIKAGTIAKDVKKSRLRAIMGRRVLPSNNFELKEEKGHYTATGSGFGHGVGMCQFGAKELALQGYTYKQILAYYFPELHLKKIY